MNLVDNDEGNSNSDFASRLDDLQGKTDALGVSANAFANAMARAFAQAVAGGKEFDDVLKSLVLRLSGLALTDAFKGLAGSLFDGFGDLFKGTATLTGQTGPAGLQGFAGAGDTAAGAAATGLAGAPQVTVHIAAPDPASYRRSEAYLSGQIARAVARGRRGM